MANKIGEYMERHSVKFIKGTVPHTIEALPDGKKRVVWKSPIEGQPDCEDTFDTVMLAIGRSSDTKNLGIDEVGIKT